MPAFATLILCCSIASWIADRSCGFIFSISSIAANPRSARTRAPASKVHRPSPNSSRTAAAVLWTKIPFATKACESLTERSKTVLSSEDDLTSISLTGSQRTSPQERSRRNSNRLEFFQSSVESAQVLQRFRPRFRGHLHREASRFAEERGSEVWSGGDSDDKENRGFGAWADPARWRD